MNGEMSLILRTVFPCCGGPCRINATVDVPREMYDRTCARCGTRYEVERITLAITHVGRFDALNWQQAHLSAN